MTAQKKKNDILQLQQRFAKEVIDRAMVIPALLLDAYMQIGLTDSELIVLLKLLEAQKHNKLDIHKIINICNISEAEAEELTEKLCSINVAQKDKEGNFAFDLLYNALFDFWVFAQMSNSEAEISPTTHPKPRSGYSKLIHAFEKEFGRGLSPIELEKLAQWVSTDKLPANMIEEALKRAVMQGKNSFAYIDRIIANWQKSGYHSLPEVETGDKKQPVMKQKKASKGDYSGAYDKIMR